MQGHETDQNDSCLCVYHTYWQLLFWPVSEPSCQQQDEQNHDHKPDNPAWKIPPVSTVRPSRERTDQEQDQYD